MRKTMLAAVTVAGMTGCSSGAPIDRDAIAGLSEQQLDVVETERAQLNADEDGVPVTVRWIDEDGEEIEIDAMRFGDDVVADGDIYLGNAYELGVADQGHRGAGLIGHSGFQSTLWPRRTVHYQVAPGTSTQFMTAAMAEWEARTGVRFVNGSSPGGHVEIRPAGAGCSATVGHLPGHSSVLNVGPGCDIRRVWLHELGHTLGMRHEHNRADRDAYVDIFWENIIPGREHNFRSYAEEGYPGVDLGPYDYDSIMHYSSFAFDDDGQPTIRRKDGSLVFTNPELSPVDVTSMQTLYEYFGDSTFDDRFYLEANGDVASALLGQRHLGAQHWISHGRAEGRLASPSFDSKFYADMNADLAGHFGRENADGLTKHWMASGIDEGRISSPVFDVNTYIERNPGLAGYSRREALTHWANVGLRFGSRASLVFDPHWYRATYSDIAAAFDARGATTHWLLHGIDEGRAGSADFDPTFYLSHNPDLGLAGIDTPREALVHFLQHGRYEGRPAHP